MIFPILKGILSPIKVPITYLFFFLNVFIFLIGFDNYQKSQKEMENLFSDTSILKTQGQLFSQFVDEHPHQYSVFLKYLARESILGDETASKRMGAISVRNESFLRKALQLKYKGSVEEFDSWKKNFKEYQNIKKNHPNFSWGLTEENQQWWNWISYQFTHSGFTHIFWNMAFFVLLGCFVESEFGSLYLLLVYLFSGIGGALVFNLLSMISGGFSGVPLVGASAAVSGLVGVILAQSFSRRISFFYWLLPVQNYFGIRDLPAWILLFIFGIPDLAGILASVQDLGSVAYTAHLGGVFTGFVCTKSYLFLRRKTAS